MKSSRIERSNDAWLEALSAAVPDAAVVEDLGGLVRGALHKALAARALDASTLGDLAQVAVVQVLAKLEHFEGRSRFTTWAYSVAVRAALTELRRPLYRDARRKLRAGLGAAGFCDIAVRESLGLASKES